jgi:pyruvate,water dikinase
VANLIQWAAKTIQQHGKSHEQATFASLFHTFQRILELNNRILEIMADMGDKLGGNYVFDRRYIVVSCQQIANLVHGLIYNFNALVPTKYLTLDGIFRSINHDIKEELAGRLVIPETEYVMPYEIITSDFDDVVGGKNANIAEIRNRLGMAVPEGFAITTRAFRLFFDDNVLEAGVEQTVKAWKAGKLTAEEASRTIMALISSGSISTSLSRAMDSAVKQLQQTTGERHLFLAVRSSAIGEDSEHTFAGQYLSLLNQPQHQLAQSYKDVLASTYSPQAMEYRRQKGFSENEVAMAVACQCMIDAKVSGVLYSMDPMDPGREVMVISATWGLGAPVVAGKVNTDRLIVSREFPHEVQAMDIVRKPERLAAAASGQGGCEFLPVDEKMQTRMCLTTEQIKELAEAALAIERYFKCPQDIEWTFDDKDNLVILQSRRLNIKTRMAQVVCDIASITDQYPVVFAHKGQIVQNGIATGKVFLVLGDEDLNQFPNGAILVAKETSPRFAKVARKASGIITDVGSSTGHMATISREFRIPTIVNTGVATQLLEPAQEITMDAQENVVYAGRIKELCYYGFMEDVFEETYEYRLLRRIQKKITPLNLVDPHSKDFAPQACKTFHDITRFVHEKAVEELIDLNYRRRLDPETPSKKLKSNIPLDLVIIDIGGGLKETDEAATVNLDQILSVPMHAFLEGLGSPDAWSREPVSVDFSSFMSSLTRTFSSHLVSPKFVGQNLAVISKAYANISLRLGYHFNMIDAYISDQVNDNYAYFRFMGGVTGPVRRSRRAKFIYETLARSNFNVDLRGDMVIGRIKKLDPELMQHKMHLLGQLVGFTRQLDVMMTSDQQIANFSNEFEQLTKTQEPTNE